MNIKAGAKGQILDILVLNGQAVKKGDPILVIKVDD
ncbi:biotin/lipoyl-binding protein [Niallia sp. Krafla_26]